MCCFLCFVIEYLISSYAQVNVFDARGSELRWYLFSSDVFSTCVSSCAFSRVLVVKKHEFGRVDQLFACTAVFEKVTLRLRERSRTLFPPSSSCKYVTVDLSFFFFLVSHSPFRPVSVLV